MIQNEQIAFGRVFEPHYYQIKVVLKSKRVQLKLHFACVQNWQQPTIIAITTIIIMIINSPSNNAKHLEFPNIYSPYLNMQYMRHIHAPKNHKNKKINSIRKFIAFNNHFNSFAFAFIFARFSPIIMHTSRRTEIRVCAYCSFISCLIAHFYSIQ